MPRSASAPEGDGYIISVVYRAATNTSELLILNAQDIAGEPAAVLKVPRRVPARFSRQLCRRLGFLSARFSMCRCFSSPVSRQCRTYETPKCDHNRCDRGVYVRSVTQPRLFALSLSDSFRRGNSLAFATKVTGLRRLHEQRTSEALNTFAMWRLNWARPLLCAVRIGAICCGISRVGSRRLYRRKFRRHLSIQYRCIWK